MLVDESTGRDLFADPLPDTRVVTDGQQLVALAAPTDRYDHGVLGDAIEASAVEIVAEDGSSRTPITIADPDVIEAVSPMLGDVDGDGSLDVVLTALECSHGRSARRLRTRRHTHRRNRTDRHRQPLAKPARHRADGAERRDRRSSTSGRRTSVARCSSSATTGRVGCNSWPSTSGYSTHVIGSRNLDLGIVTDADGDGRLDVLLPSQDRDELAVVTRDDEAENGAIEVERVSVGRRSDDQRVGLATRR